MTDEQCPGRWFAVEAPWVLPPLNAHGLIFETGDSLVEYYSPDDWFNAFRVESPDGGTRGWYGNVTHPTHIHWSGDVVTVTWHDLYLDVIRLPDESVLLCDEDELAESGLAIQEPQLHARIERTATVMVGLAEACEFPFHKRQ